MYTFIKEENAENISIIRFIVNLLKNKVMLKELRKSMIGKSLIVALSFLIVSCCLVGCGDNEEIDDTEINQGGSNTFQIADLVGTWEIVHSNYTYKVNGVVVESGSEDVSEEHNRIVFYPNGNFEFHEYSDTEGTWHEDGKGTLYMRNGKLECIGDFEDFAIVSLASKKLVVKYKFVEEKGSEIHEEEFIDTMERVEQF